MECFIKTIGLTFGIIRVIRSKMIVRKIIGVFVLVFACSVANAQRILPVHITLSDSSQDLALYKSFNRKFQADSFHLPQLLEKVKGTLAAFGYMNPNIEISNKDSSFELYISKGFKYEYIIKSFNDTSNILQVDTKNIYHIVGNKTTGLALEKSIQKFLNIYENNGYPFASFYIKPTTLTERIVEANLIFNAGPQFIIDQVEVIGDAKIRQSYIEYYIGVKKGTNYNESMIVSADNKLRQLSFVAVYKPIQVYFEGSKAKVRIFLNQSKANNFDGVVGLQPDETGKRSFILTGEFHLQIPNLFNRGVETTLDYRSFAGNSQDFKTKVNVPNFLKSPLGVDAAISVLKFDTTYIDVNTQIGFRYQPNPSNYLRVFYEHQNIFLLNIDTLAIRQTRQLPNFNDLTAGNYGINISLKKLDFAPNPLKGYSIDATAQVGLRNLQKNKQINDMIFKSQQGDSYHIYDSIKLNTVQYKLIFKSNIYIKVSKYSCVLWSLNGGANFINHIFQNDMYRIGGLNTVRGFNEQSIFATTYAISNYEYRYLLSTYSHAVAFLNSGWYEKKWDKGYTQNIIYSVGAGVQLKTGGGILKLFYALGQTAGTPFSVANGRVHLGYVNNF